MEKSKMSNKSNHSEGQKFPIIWANPYSEKRQKTFNLGTCGYCWKPAFIGPDIETITINDFYLNEQSDICEEGQCCLNIKCRFNKTTPKSYAMSKGWESDERINTVKKLWSKLTSDLISYQAIADECKKAYDNDPNVRAIEFQNRRGNGVGE
jgi:hypothetical protein